MKEIKKIFHNVEAKLKSKAWFKEGKWIVSTHGFPEKNPEAVTFHVFKKHWFNEDKQGIHIESYLMLDPKKRKKSYITIHVLHHAKIPGTNIKRVAIAKSFVDAVFDQVKEWDGYKFRTGKYGVQPFTKVLDGANKDFGKILAAEVELIGCELGPEMDRAIEDAFRAK